MSTFFYINNIITSYSFNIKNYKNIPKIKSIEISLITQNSKLPDYLSDSMHLLVHNEGKLHGSRIDRNIKNHKKFVANLSKIENVHTCNDNFVLRGATNLFGFKESAITYYNPIDRFYLKFEHRTDRYAIPALLEKELRFKYNMRSYTIKNVRVAIRLTFFKNFKSLTCREKETCARLFRLPVLVV